MQNEDFLEDINADESFIGNDLPTLEDLGINSDQDFWNEVQRGMDARRDELTDIDMTPAPQDNPLNILFWGVHPIETADDLINGMDELGRIMERDEEHAARVALLF